MDKKISVVIPAFNAEKYLNQTLISLQNQTVQPKEIIVVDDGSVDDTLPLVYAFSEYLPVRIIQHDRNCGIGKTRNGGALAASTDYVAFLSADDCYLPTFIEESLPFLDGVVATYTAYYHCDENLRNPKLFQPPQFSRGSVIEWALKKNMYVNFSSVIIPRHVFDTVKFQDALRHGEDLIFLLDTVIAGLQWRLVDEPLLRYRVHSKAGSYAQNFEEFGLLWRFLVERLRVLNINDGVIESAFAESSRNTFPPFHRKLLSYVYHKIFR